jgi:hypothetical protein
MTYLVKRLPNQALHYLIMPPTHRHRKETHRELIVGLLTASSCPRAADFLTLLPARPPATGLRTAT